MKTKIILLALVATFTISLLSSCSSIDCDDEIRPMDKYETEVEAQIEVEIRNKN